MEEWLFGGDPSPMQIRERLERGLDERLLEVGMPPALLRLIRGEYGEALAVVLPWPHNEFGRIEWMTDRVLAERRVMLPVLSVDHHEAGVWWEEGRLVHRWIERGGKECRRELDWSEATQLALAPGLEALFDAAAEDVDVRLLRDGGVDVERVVAIVVREVGPEWADLVRWASQPYEQRRPALPTVAPPIPRQVAPRSRRHLLAVEGGFRHHADESPIRSEVLRGLLWGTPVEDHSDAYGTGCLVDEAAVRRNVTFTSSALGARVVHVDKACLLYALGLRPGHIVHSVNGHSLRSRADAEVAGDALMAADRLDVLLKRKVARIVVDVPVRIDVI